MANSLTQALRAHFESVFAGPNGDYPALLETLAGLTAAQAAWKPAPRRNSIWQIVDHLTDSTLWQIEVLEKGQAAVPEWTQPAGDESAWRASVARLKEAHARLQVALGQVPETDLLAAPAPGEQPTQLELLLSSAAHEAHHGGQIDYLKGLQAEAVGK